MYGAGHVMDAGNAYQLWDRSAFSGSGRSDQDLVDRDVLGLGDRVDDRAARCDSGRTVPEARTPALTLPVTEPRTAWSQ
ncbi:hypothetical protein GCM10010121_085040 [Streptomyces brasiliensis]|uniref:Uncharacterized protein n=1 Tax=Streptomyces brasiliensis TaxID=1954 RepID=A0A917UIY5_9ACTN|nr:hypothetical protein GCM10010121_085040 [Streptomyces brasiliensis]